MISGSRRVCLSLAANSASPSSGPPAAFGTTCVARCSPMASSSAAARSAAARRRGRSAATSGSDGGGLGLGHRVAREPGDPADPLRGDVRVEPRDRTVRVRPDERSRLVEHPREALQPGGRRREADRQRREVAGQQRMERAAQDVHPHHRVPGLLAEPVIGEARGLELAQDEVAVDAVVGRERGRIQRREGRRPAIDEGQPLGAARLAVVGPAVVVAVVAHPGGGLGLEREQLVEEGGDEVGDGGHGHLRRSGSRPRIARATGHLR